MKQIYAWNRFSYSWNLKLTKIDISNIKWLWSNKKSKYYYKLEKEINWLEYMFIWFKNDYILIYEKWKAKWMIEWVRNYYHIIKDWIAYEIIPSFEMPF